MADQGLGTANWMPSAAEVAASSNPQQFIRSMLERFDTTPVTIAMCGESGAGKSTIINTLRGLKPGEPGAARVSVVECTSVPTPYPWPRHENVTLVDLPGCNTQKFPVETYVRDVRLADYDMALVVYSGRVHANDIVVAQKLKELGKPFWFVRTKFDNDVRDYARDHGESIKADRELASAREKMESANGDLEFQRAKELVKRAKDFKANVMAKAKLDARAIIEKNLKDDTQDPQAVFFTVCGVLGDEHLYDMTDLMKSMAEALPGLKRAIFILRVHTTNRQLIDEKTKVLRESIFWYVAASSLVAAVPIVGVSGLVDLGMICRFVFTAADAYGITRERLAQAYGPGQFQQYAYEVRLKFSESLSLLAAGQQAAMMILEFLKMEGAAFIALNTAEEFARLLPVFGSIIAAVLSGATMHKTLHFFLADIEKQAKEATADIVAHAH